MIRDALIVALRSGGQPMSSGELVEHMPWIRRDQRSPHPDDWRCEGLPEDAPRPGLCVRVLRCTGAIHTVDRRTPSHEVSGHLRALVGKGLVRLAEGTVPGRHNLWELTDAGAADGEIEELRCIVDLDQPGADGRADPSVDLAGTDGCADLGVDLTGAVPIESRVAAAEGESIDWRCVVEQLGRFDEAACTADRSHLITADTWRYVVAEALGDNGIAMAQLELTGVCGSDYAAMTLYGRRRTAIAVADLRDDSSPRSAVSATLMEVLYRTSQLHADEHVIVLIGGVAARGQIQAHLPGVTVGETAGAAPCVLQFQRAVLAGLPFDGFSHEVPDLTLKPLGCRAVVEYHHILVLAVGTCADGEHQGDVR